MTQPPDALDLVDLAAARFGGRALLTNDDFFAPMSNLVRDEAPIWDEGRYTERGKWMDGWESRRRREPGHDWCILALGLPGVPERLVIDTAFFRGNYPEACAVQACHAPGVPADDLAAAEGVWHELLPRTPLQGDHRHELEVSCARPVTHLRLAIFPDGGVARLRVLGRVQAGLPELLTAPAPHDLGGLALGGRVLGCSDAFFSQPQNLISPARSVGMHDGWETRRRRGPGHDWVVLALGQAGRIDQIEVDTSFFKGNAPGRCALQVSQVDVAPADFDAAPGPDGPWRTLLADAPLRPHALHLFADELRGERRASVVRFDIHPDGGVARLRLPGLPDAVSALQPGLERWQGLPDASARAALLDCCGSAALADALLAKRPYADAGALVRAAHILWPRLRPDDWREAFAAHPEIGARAPAHAATDTAPGETHPAATDTAPGTSSGAPPGGASPGSAPPGAATSDAAARSARWSADEQGPSDHIDADVAARLAAGNRAYRERFGFVFLVCASGRSPEEMLALLERRMTHDAATELAIAAEEQRRITTLRLIKLLGEP